MLIALKVTDEVELLKYINCNDYTYSIIKNGYGAGLWNNQYQIVGNCIAWKRRYIKKFMLCFDTEKQQYHAITTGNTGVESFFRLPQYGSFTYFYKKTQEYLRREIMMFLLVQKINLNDNIIHIKSYLFPEYLMYFLQYKKCKNC